MVKVGEVTGSLTPSARAAPRISVVFPAPSSPLTRTTSPGPRSAASRSPRASVSAGLRVRALTSVGSAAEQAHLVRLELAFPNQRFRLRERLLQKSGDLAEILSQLLGDTGGAQAGGGMEERQHEDPASADQVLLRRASDLGDSSRVGREQLRGEIAERADDARLNQLDLLLQVGAAGVDLLGLRVSVAGRPALENVRDEDVIPLQPDPLQQIGQEAAGAAHERQALPVLLGPRCLAHEHQVRVGVSGPEDDPVARLRKGAALADRGLVVDLYQRLAASLGAAHELPRRRAADLSAARCRLKRSLAPPRPVPRLSSRRRFWLGV